MSGDSLWYKDAVIYQLHVRAFHDSNGDGIGDFRGLTEKLDYLEDLGITAIWLQPFYPSPLRDDGYDIAHYRSVHPDYGTLSDFRTFLREAHKRGLRVITELVINHTSDQHPWFQRSRRAAPGSRRRNFYVWSDTPDRYQETRIIFKDFEASNWTWDPTARAYFWHRFYSHQPDLNFDNPEVRKAVLKIMDFWFGMGVDGLRLDAVPYLYEREGTNCENLPETHAYLKGLRRHVDETFQDRMLLAEANQWPEDAVAYFGDGDECHMAFHFPVMPRLFMAIHMEDRFPIVDILEQTPPIPDNSQWAIFLRNHDELTLEMVTDEDRDYMYRVYAHDHRARINLGIRRRLAPLMGNNRRRVELMNSLLLSLPGTPIIYYGDEIGMGDNIFLGDRNGVRTPMQWSPDRNAGFSRSNPQRLYLPIIVDPEYHYEAVNVDAQQNNPNSLLWWMKRLIALRKRSGVFGRGITEFLHPENRKVLAFLRRWEDECFLVVANLSRFVQCVELDLSQLDGLVPVELFGRTHFPPITPDPYFITLAPHAFYWFGMEAPSPVEPTAPTRRPAITVAGPWHDVLAGKKATTLERHLPGYLQQRRWFGGKARQVLGTRITDAIPVPTNGAVAYLTLIDVTYSTGDPETYLLPLGFAVGDAATALAEHSPQAVLADLRAQGSGGEIEGVLFDAFGEAAFCTALAEIVARRRSLRGWHGTARGFSNRFFREAIGESDGLPDPLPLKAEQSNTSVMFGDRIILKTFRRISDGVNPDLEIGRFLTERTRFRNIAPVTGGLEYRRDAREPATLAVMHGYVPNEGDAWRYTLDILDQYLEGVLAQAEGSEAPPPPSTHILDDLDSKPPQELWERIGHYLEAARLLGQRTAEMHLALASRTDDPAFAPEPMSAMYQRSLYQSVRSRASEVLDLLRDRLGTLTATAEEDARLILESQEQFRRYLRLVADTKIKALRIRCHGDYHLGQVLHTGKDFIILDFEGEPARSLGERRLKRSPLRDVAGMIRSFHYAAVTALFGGKMRAEDVPTLDPWVRLWYHWVAAAFYRSYVHTAEGAPILPASVEHQRILLDHHLLDKALYELAYELNNRPAWVRIPLRGIAGLLQAEAADR